MGCFFIRAACGACNQSHLRIDVSGISRPEGTVARVIFS